MSKEHTSKYIPPIENSYLAPHVQPKVRSHIVPKVTSRIQPKLMFDRKPKHNPLEQEADEMGKRASEGKEVNIDLASDGNIQKKEADPKINDKGESKHAKGKFDNTNNSYTVPEASVYEDPQQAFDTLYSISVRFGVSMEAIKKENKLESDAVVAGQVLIIPTGSVIKEEPKPVKQEIKQITNPKPKPLVLQKQESAASLIKKHTSYMMLNEEALAKELAKNYLFTNPAIVSEVLKQVEEWNEDDVSSAILNIVPLTQRSKIDKKVLKDIYSYLNSGVVGDDEKMRIEQLDKILNPKTEVVPRQKPIVKLPEIVKQQINPKVDSTSRQEEAIKEIKSNPDTANENLFSIDKSKANAVYLQQMYNNKNEGKWQKENVKIDEALSEIEQRVEIAKQIEQLDKRKYGQAIIGNGRLIDNIVDCAEFVSEVAWIQGYQTYPSGGCDDQLNWFKKNGEWGDSFSEIKVGDVIFWDRDIHEGITNSHTAIIVEKLSDGSVKYVHSSGNGGGESINAPKFPTTITGTANPNQPKYRLNFLAWGRFNNKTN